MKSAMTEKRLSQAQSPFRQHLDLRAHIHIRLHLDVHLPHGQNSAFSSLSATKEVYYA
jgi:hypothetical protein